jgi:tRNA1(Val) A37 N6-methylase TrmN6
MKAALALLAPGGLFLMIHRADALPAILKGAAGRVGGLRLLPVAPRENEPATRLLVGGRKGSRAPLAILPPLILHGADGAFTSRAESIHRGEQGIDLGLH